MNQTRDFPGQPPAAASPLLRRDFEFSEAQFEGIRQLIYRKAGISLSPIKREMVYSRLARRLRALGLDDFGAYLDLLDSGDESEMELFINALTTNLTSFFREGRHFEILKQQMLGSSSRPFTIWCSAVSSGEEAYSAAIAACEVFATLQPPVRILASDIDTSVLKTAKEGVYPIERVERMALDRLRKYFLKGRGARTGSVRVRRELQALIGWSRVNLLDADWSAIGGPHDAIFCRNVMIYFDKRTQRKILGKFAPLLREDGLLYAGHSESFMHASDLVRPLGRTVYERTDNRQPRVRFK